MTSPYDIEVREEKIVKNNLRKYIENHDPIRGIYPLYFMGSRDLDRTRLFVSLSGEVVQGYLFTYDSEEYNMTWAYLHCNTLSADPLMELFPKGGVIISTGEDVHEIVKSKVDIDSVNREDILIVRGGEERLTSPDRAVRVGPKFVAEYSNLVAQEGSEVTEKILESNRRFLSEEVVYGVFAEDGTLASVASTNARASSGWILSNVVTSDKFRRKGYASAAVSALTSEALRNVNLVALFVDSENAEARTLYENLGFHKIERSIQIYCGMQSSE